MLKCGHITKEGLVIKAWTYELLSKKDVIYDLAGQKQVWLLDLQVDQEFTMLVALVSKGFVTSR
jgi:hypothetical protein